MSLSFGAFFATCSLLRPRPALPHRAWSLTASGLASRPWVTESHVVERAWAGGADRDIGSTGGRSAQRVCLVIPTRGAMGKSRLVAPPGVDHRLLARAIAQDTIEAALACVGGACVGGVGGVGVRVGVGVGTVYVVTGDGPLASWAVPGCVVLPDPGGGLNAAIAAGLAMIPATASAGVLLGDLPALTPDVLGTALTAAFEPSSGCARSRPAYVPDAAGTGTVLLLGRAAQVRPAFGPGSAAAHERYAVRLALDLPGLRRDVDDAADLAVACRLGVGRHTRAVLRTADP